ncbi:MAG TPA: ATP-binding cassette domain-containing protein [Streptomyces sp.]|nr:ATP-binding cassette domain-containing protein [Streptomyces sp.]
MHAIAVTARDFGLRGPRGWAFRGVSFDAEPGSLVTVVGPSGSGRTCLLLALTGRMRATEGTAAVGGARLPRRMSAARRVSALAHVAGVTELESALTVAEHLREQALLQRRFGGPLRALLRPRGERPGEAEQRVESAPAAAGLDCSALPKGARTAVRDLERLEALRLSVALALVGRPRLLGVDDADLKLSPAEREEVWALLRAVADGGTTVVAVCSEAPDGAIVVPTRPAPGADEAATDGAGNRDDDGDGNRDDDDGDRDDSDSDRRTDGGHGEAAADAFAETGRA